MGFDSIHDKNTMETALTEWLLQDRPYTHLHTRVRQFILFCRTLEPGLSYSYLRKHILPIVDQLMLGDLGRLWMRDRCFERVIRLYGENDQRTTQWHAKRGEMITASEVYQVFGTQEARRSVMLRKLEPAVASSGSVNIPALAWGTRFEPIAKRLYEEQTKCKILDVSCVQHPRYAFLGASPDGLIIPHDDLRRYGRLVEFKCPMSRAPKDEIPQAYWHQMQLQMECTGIDECEYVEFRFKQVLYSEWVKSTDAKGYFTVYDDGRVVYDQDESTDESQVVYWILQSVKDVFVPKDPAWLSSHIDELQTFWDEVVEHRKNGTKPEKPSLPAFNL
jgi:putative phage-type endonuclease